jgi:hypothetical protein
MRSTFVVLSLLLASSAVSACVHPRGNALCPYDDSMHSSLATEFSSDTGVVAGRVVSIALEPLTGARIALLPSTQHLETRADGRFRFSHLAPGDYEIVVEQVGYGSARGRVRLLPNGGTRVTATLGASVVCLTGRMVPADRPAR